MGGAASLQTSKGSVFGPFGLEGFSTVKTPELFQSHFLYICLYCKYLREVRLTTQRTSLNEGCQPVNESGRDISSTVIHSQLLEHSHYSKVVTP